MIVPLFLIMCETARVDYIGQQIECLVGSTVVEVSTGVDGMRPRALVDYHRRLIRDPDPDLIGKDGFEQ